jgi:hypothetical protein
MLSGCPFETQIHQDRFCNKTDRNHTYKLPISHFFNLCPWGYSRARETAKTIIQISILRSIWSREYIIGDDALV